MTRACFPNVSQFPIRKTLSPVSIFVFKKDDAYATRQGILTKIRACEHLQKILRARASEHSSNFCEQFEQRPNFASTFKLAGTIRYPLEFIALHPFHDEINYSFSSGKRNASSLVFCDHFSSSKQTFRRLPAFEPGFDRNKSCKRVSTKKLVHYCFSHIKYFTAS